jgi:hypothetical protein
MLQRICPGARKRKKKGLAVSSFILKKAEGPCQSFFHRMFLSSPPPIDSRRNFEPVNWLYF